MLVDGSVTACKALRKDGALCQAVPTRSSYCLAHDPALEQKRQRARIKGGHGKSKSARAEKLVPSQLKSIYSLLIKTLMETYEGVLEPRRATALGTLPRPAARFTRARRWRRG